MIAIPGGIPAGAACLDGHFPGNPIVPGAVLLGHAARHLAGQGVTLTGVQRMKFLRPLAPETGFDIRLDPARRLLEWRAGEVVLARAQVALSDG